MRFALTVALVWILTVLLLFPSTPSLADFAAEYGLLSPSTTETGVSVAKGMRLTVWNILIICGTTGLLASTAWAAQRLMRPRTFDPVLPQWGESESPLAYGGVSPYELDQEAEAPERAQPVQREDSQRAPRHVEPRGHSTVEGERTPPRDRRPGGAKTSMSPRAE